MGNIFIKDTRCLMCKKYIYYNGIKCITCNSFYDKECFQSYNEFTDNNTKCPKCKLNNTLFQCDNNGSISYINEQVIKL
jgi:hypothetical protein